MKKNYGMIGIISCAGILFLSVTAPIFALTTTPSVKPNREKPIKERVSNAAELNRIRKKITIKKGEITAINDSTLTITENGTIYTITTGSSDECTTKFKRRYFGDSSLAEVKMGHTVQVVGRITDDENKTIHACILRDVSIEKFRGTFIGKITSITTDGFKMTTVSSKRADQEVFIETTTKITDRREKAIKQEDLKEGDRVQVKGLWDRSDNTVTEVKSVKDFSIPPIPTNAKKILSPTPTQTT